MASFTQRHTWLVAGTSMVTSLSQFNRDYQYKYTFPGEQQDEKEKEASRKAFMDKMRKDMQKVFSPLSSSARLISYTTKAKSSSKAIGSDPSEVQLDNDVYAMAVCDKVTSKTAWLVWRGTNLQYFHEPGMSTGNPLHQFLGLDSYEMKAKDLFPGVPGTIRKSTAMAFAKPDILLGSLQDQIIQYLTEVDAEELVLCGYSMGASMAVLASIVACKLGKFKKIRLYLWGAFPVLSEETAAWLIDQGVEAETYEIFADPVPYLDELVNGVVLRGLLWGQLGHPGDPEEFKPTFVHVGKVFRMYTNPFAYFSSLNLHANKMYQSAFMSAEVLKALYRVGRTPTETPSIQAFVEEKSPIEIETETQAAINEVTKEEI